MCADGGRLSTILMAKDQPNRIELLQGTLDMLILRSGFVIWDIW